MNVTDLLDQLSRDIPALRGARCRGQSDLFDITDGHQREAITKAAALCATCPASEACARWLASLPPHRRPWGVVAGKFVRPPTPKPLPERKPKQPNKTDRAADWPANYLADGPVLSTPLHADATAAGIGRDALRRACRHLNVQLERATGTSGGQRIWSLPYNSNNGRKPTMMSDDDINEFMPDHMDFARAKVFVEGWATSDEAKLRRAVHQATITGHPVRFFGALAEMICRAYDLRDNPGNLADWGSDIMLHIAAQQAGEDDE